MRSSNKSRSRNKNNNRNRNVGNIVNRVFDSAGPEGKVRGTPQQIIEKYALLARDAQLSGDRVAAENFQQHGEHYTRMLEEAQREHAQRQAEQQQRQQQQPRGDQQNDDNRNNGADRDTTGIETVETSDDDSNLVDLPENASDGAKGEERKPRPRRPRNRAPKSEVITSEGTGGDTAAAE